MKEYWAKIKIFKDTQNELIFNIEKLENKSKKKRNKKRKL